MDDQSVVDIEDCGVHVGLPGEQRRELHRMMMENPIVFHGKPGQTILVEHEVHTGDALPTFQKPYQILYTKRELVKEELEGMLAAGVIRPSTSPWASPIVLVPKKDEGYFSV